MNSTLIWSMLLPADWIAGIQSELTRLFGTQQSARLLGRHHDFEPRARARPIRAGEQPDLLGLGEPVH